MTFSKDFLVVLALLLFTVGMAYWASLQQAACFDPNSKPSVWQITPWSTKLALFQLGAAFWLALFTLSRRFVDPIPYTAESVRVRGEYLISMAQLFQKANATSLALELLAAQLRRDLAVRVGLMPTVSPEELIALLNRQDPALASQTADLLNELIQSQARPSEGRALQLAQKMALLRKEWSGFS